MLRKIKKILSMVSKIKKCQLNVKICLVLNEHKLLSLFLMKNLFHVNTFCAICYNSFFSWRMDGEYNFSASDRIHEKVNVLVHSSKSLCKYQIEYQRH